MIGFQLLPQGMQNGGTQLSTMSLRWLVLVFSVSPMPCLSSDGISSNPLDFSNTFQSHKQALRKEKVYCIYIIISSNCVILEVQTSD